MITTGHSNGKGNTSSTTPPVPPQWSDGEAERNEGGTGGAGSARPDPEVLEKPERRRFSAEYKLRIVREADANPGRIGELLRREGLYSSHLTTWRRQREAGELEGLRPQKRGRKGREKHPLEARVVQLEREKQRLEKRLKKAETIIDVQKKIAELLGIQLSQVDDSD